MGGDEKESKGEEGGTIGGEMGARVVKGEKGMVGELEEEGKVENGTCVS